MQLLRGLANLWVSWRLVRALPGSPCCPQILPAREGSNQFILGHNLLELAKFHAQLQYSKMPCLSL